MKKVLIIGYIWPYHTMAGMLVRAIAKYLPEFGWEPVVLTTPLPEKTEMDYQVVEVPYRDMISTGIRWLGFDTDKSVKKQLSQKLGVTAKKSFLDHIFRILHEVLIYPDSKKGWRVPAIRKAAELIHRENISAIITDNPPVLAQLIASKLKRKYRIPWIAYFSHLWSQNNGYPYGSLRKMFDRKLELKTLALADLMMTHSEPQAARQRELHKGKPVLAVFEGFDPEMVNDPPADLTEKFSITYTGMFAPGLREPNMLLIALKNLLSEGILNQDRVAVRFYGPEETWIDNEIEKYGLSGVVKQYGRAPMAVAQAKQRESQVLFNPKWDDPEDPGIYSGKFFEYLAARRPILAIGKYRDVVDEMLEATKAGICVSSVEDTERVLEAMYREYKDEGKVKYSGDATKLDKSTYRELAGRFAEELDRLT